MVKLLNEIEVKSILNKHKKKDDWFLDDYSVNPYSGCSFNCIYCYIRGSKYGENMANIISKNKCPGAFRKAASQRSKERRIWYHCPFIFNRTLYTGRREAETNQKIS